MGTRHMQIVINKDGVTKISQYGQWDGYPGGQGTGILDYLRKGDLDKYQEELDKIQKMTQDQIDMVNSTEDWKKVYPYLSRDCGSDIHQMIEDGVVKFVSIMDESEGNKWCEGFYTIDFQKGEFTSEFHGSSAVYKLSNLPTEEEYLSDMKDNNEDED
jgi:hypothetical protein